MTVFYAFVVLLYVYKKFALQKLLTKREIGVIISTEKYEREGLICLNLKTCAILLKKTACKKK